ncbi:MAG: hypothetical protein GY793_08435 [Proteobacteria bacterium]|nr:hypothetical protein [Pseudomonadota bacterium]
MIKCTTDKQYNKVYEFLFELEFPYTPEDKEDALQQLKAKGVHIYMENFGVIIFVEKAGKLYFDACIKKEYQNKWLNKKAISFIKDIAFRHLKYPDLFVETVSNKSFNLAKKRFKQICSNFFVIDNSVYS